MGILALSLSAWHQLMGRSKCAKETRQTNLGNANYTSLLRQILQLIVNVNTIISDESGWCLIPHILGLTDISILDLILVLKFRLISIDDEDDQGQAVIFVILINTHWLGTRHQ